MGRGYFLDQPAEKSSGTGVPPVVLRENQFSVNPVSSRDPATRSVSEDSIGDASFTWIGYFR